MDVETITTLISTLGFPIVVCIALFWYINKQATDHKAETETLRKTIEENTTILAQLKELINVLVQKEK